MISSRLLYLTAIVAVLAVAAGSASALATARDPVYVRSSAHGRITRTVAGVRFSLNVPRGWWNGPNVRVDRRLRTLGLYVSKNIVGPQDADVLLLWTAFPDGGLATQCLLGWADRTAADLAVAMSNAPGIRVIEGPKRVVVDGHPAWHTLLRVRRDRGCDPGYFFTWASDIGGAFWEETRVGYDIEVWVVEVGRKRLVFEGEFKHAWSGYPQVAKMVDSIRFG